MTEFQVTRAHLKAACEQHDWDLLDRLLDIDRSAIDDNALFTDTWGEWWGLLMQCVLRNQPDGVRVLLKHGADRTRGTWGDCLPLSPEDAAAEGSEILALLQAPGRPTYTRTREPRLPKMDPAELAALERQARIRDQTGLVFPIDPGPNDPGRESGD